MRYAFSVVYELDCTLGEAVAAYLDMEHYAYLHETHVTLHEVIKAEGAKVTVRQCWHLLGIKAGHEGTMEYVPPGQFLQYDFRPYPRWIPSIYHVIGVHTDLRYTPGAGSERTVSNLVITLDLPFWLWPLRRFIESKLRRLKIEKDQEDIDMIARRQALFGRGNLAAYFVPHQFMLHKELFIEHFGDGKPAAAAERTA